MPNSDHRDVVPDEMQYICQGEDGLWRYFDCGHEECVYPRQDLARAFVAGKYHSMLLVDPATDMQCGVYNKSGTLLDTITTKD